LCAVPQSALSKLAVGVLQRPFDALLQDCTQRLKVMYIGAGLISFPRSHGLPDWFSGSITPRAFVERFANDDFDP